MSFVGPPPCTPCTPRTDDSRGSASVAPADLPVIAPVLGAEAIVVFAVLMGVILNAGSIAGWMQ